MTHTIQEISLRYRPQRFLLEKPKRYQLLRETVYKRSTNRVVRSEKSSKPYETWPIRPIFLLSMQPLSQPERAKPGVDLQSSPAKSRNSPSKQLRDREHRKDGDGHSKQHHGSRRLHRKDHFERFQRKPKHGRHFGPRSKSNRSR